MAGGDKVAGVYSEIEFRFNPKSLKNLKKFKDDIRLLKKEIQSLNKMKVDSKIGSSRPVAQAKTRLQRAQQEMEALNKSLEIAKKKGQAADKELAKAKKIGKEQTKLAKEKEAEKARASKAAQAEAKSLQRARAKEAATRREVQILREKEKLEKRLNKAGIEGSQGGFRGGFARSAKAYQEGRISKPQFDKTTTKMYQKINPLISKNIALKKREAQAHRKAGQAMQGTWRWLAKVGAAQQRANQAAQKSALTFQKLRSAVIGLTGAYTAFAAAQNINHIGQEFESAGIMMEVAMGEHAGESMEFLIEQSRRLGIDVAANAKGFARYALAAKQMGFSFEEIKEQFLGVAEAATVFGLAPEEIRGTIRALEQMAS